MNMAMDRQVQLFGQGEYALKSDIGYGVGRMWRQAEADQRVVQPHFPDGESFIYVIVCIARVGRRKFDGGDADHGAHTVFGSGCWRQLPGRNTCH
jgi:hypothetical protein